MTQTPWRVLGGRLGSHTSSRSGSLGRAAQLAVLLTALPVLLALAVRGWCLSNGFGGQAPLWRACYSDLPAALGSIKVSSDLAEPLVTATAMRAVALAVDGSGTGSQQVYVVLWALVSLIGVGLLAMAVVAYRSEQPERALLLVLCPAVPTAMLISADIVGVTLAVGGLLAWRLRRDATAGLLLAAAVFSRSYALILVVAVLVLAIRTRRSLSRFVAGLAGGAVVLVALAATLGWGTITVPLRQWWQAVPSYGSFWMLPSVAASSGQASHGEWLRAGLTHLVVPQSVAPWISVAGWLLAIGLVAWVARTSWRAPASADLALLGTCIVLLTSITVPVQAALWLAPLVALSSLTWRDLLIWAGVEVLYFPMVWLYIGGLANPDRGLPGGWYGLVLGLRLVAIGYLAFRALEEARYGGEPALREG